MLHQILPKTWNSLNGSQKPTFKNTNPLQGEDSFKETKLFEKLQKISNCLPHLTLLNAELSFPDTRRTETPYE